MPLHERVNGRTSDSLISAEWFNEYYRLLTGKMSDQPVQIAQNLTLRAISSKPVAPGVVTETGTGLTAGTYKYAVTFCSQDGESLPSNQVPVTIGTDGKGIVRLTNIPAGPLGCTKKRVYRTKAGASTLYRLAEIVADATEYVDTTPDAARPQQLTEAPKNPTFGGALIFADETGKPLLTICNDGSIVGSGGGTSIGGTSINGDLTVSGKSLLDNGAIKTDGAGRITFERGEIRMGVNGNAGNVLIADTNGDLYIKTRQVGSYIGAIRFHVPDSVPVVSFTKDGIEATGKSISCKTLNVNGGVATFNNDCVINGDLRVKPNNTSTPSAIIVGSAGFGVKQTNGTKLLQATTDGLVVGGPNVRTSTPTFNWSAGGTFANFDYAEVVPVDDLYDFGTVICPSDSNPDYWTRCTHVACPAAMVIVESPGMSLGVANNPNQYYGQNPWYNPNLPLSFHAALVGRVAVPSMQEDIPLRAFVCSDGNGGIRAMADDEHGMALGVCIGPVLNGKAPVLLRPVWR